MASPFLFPRMFVDEIKVYARAGHGGKGCIAFMREAYRPKGGPSGGNGGRGGNVILQADHDLNNLINQYYQPRLIAQDGEGGMGKGTAREDDGATTSSGTCSGFVVPTTRSPSMSAVASGTCLPASSRGFTSKS